MKYDLVLLHAPSVYDFRENSLLAGPISDVVPSSPVFEMYPIGLTSIADYLERYGLKVRIINIANRMLMDPKFDVEKKLRGINTRAFGIDLHWLPHAHGSIELAKIVKNLHPETPIVFGGLSSTYYHKDLIEYPFIDFVMRGDSTEKLMLMLMNKLEFGNSHYEEIPNLTWKRGTEIGYNPLSYVPKDLDEFDVPGYRYTIRSVFKYKNFMDPLPYNGWLQYPNTAILTARGCTQRCLICGGSKEGYDQNCNRQSLALRSPAKLIEDIQFIQRFSRAPIFILHDIRQGGKQYVEEFFSRLKQITLKNELVFELFQYADEKFFEQINEAVPKYSIELTLETHDEKIRKYNGKFSCTNEKVIDSLNFALKHGCKKIDLFFMVGIPGQTYESVLENVDFAERIHLECGQDPRLFYFIAPLAPFLDPASAAFENPELHGYKKLCHTLEDHRKAITQPSWKHMLSYETVDMTRDDIVNSTYESARLLNKFKLKYGLIDQASYDDIENKIEKSIHYIERIDHMMTLPEDEYQIELANIKKEIEELNKHSICGSNELKWEVQKNYANFFSLAMVGLEQLFEDYSIKFRKQFHPKVRHQVKLDL
ncbi:TIGR04190 family B12-binding domain/radical SAM domain protein [Neobacillus notoginsengisoli]|uniref:TIGR04190 family B12-binding domain/radical SAM domain protein n=1 Tax=Neobacillus notoginsengisoli TaxID=1578198 RepID=A0A417YT91_9BACI|nr:TIGR04190 family B12-binding domain/radical SAM domain protein [Neobacillus notoginsengisoli]RHW40288.1 TIGR04190 family B12-binding domain/radical SAM domain protein [Neobacillus notoginsengisoli]